MKIALISDTHIGLTNPKSLRKMFKKLAKKEFNLLLHCGDYCGGTDGARSVRSTLRMIREEIPDKPMLSVIGNHDFWKAKPSHTKFKNNYAKILEAFKTYNVHFLDEDGFYEQDGFYFIGHTGWYSELYPYTNDQYYLPSAYQSTDLDLHGRGFKAIYKQLDSLEFHLTHVKQLCFVSHFPVIRPEGQSPEEFQSRNWSETFGDYLQTHYNIEYFFCGHAHQNHNGPLRYECGSDYGKPAYKIVEVKCKSTTND